MNQIIDVILVAILLLAGLVMAGIAAIDSFLSDAMTYAGVPALSQIIILFALVFWLIAMAVRLLGPVFSTLITLLLILLFVHRIFPHLEPPAPPTRALTVIHNTI
jgi:hypothetical protein